MLIHSCASFSCCQNLTSAYIILYVSTRTSNWNYIIISPRDPWVIQYKLLLCYVLQAMRTFTAFLAFCNCGSKISSGNCVAFRNVHPSSQQFQELMPWSEQSCRCSDGCIYLRHIRTEHAASPRVSKKLHLLQSVVFVSYCHQLVQLDRITGVSMTHNSS